MKIFLGIILGFGAFACGGSPFVEVVEVNGADDGGGNDAELARDGQIDSATLRFDAGDGGISGDSSGISNESDSGYVNTVDATCEGQSTFHSVCGGVTIAYPTETCVLIVGANGGSDTIPEITPSQCDSLGCTFNCACLMGSSVCPGLQYSVTKCEVLDGGGIEVECSQ